MPTEFTEVPSDQAIAPSGPDGKDQEPIVEVPARRALLYSKFEFQAPPVALTLIKCLADFVARAGFGRRQTAKVHALIGAVKQRFKYLVG